MLSKPSEGLVSLLTTGKEDMPSFIIPMDGTSAFPGEEKSSSQAHCEPLPVKLASQLMSLQSLFKFLIASFFSSAYNSTQALSHHSRGTSA